MKKIIASVVAVCAIILAATPALAPDITATAEVEGYCDLTIDPTTPLDFGTLSQGATSGAESRDAVLDANTPTVVTISGTGWTGANPANTMSVGQTDYGLDGAPDTGLTDSPVELFNSEVDITHTVQVQVSIPDPQPADTYSQTITLGFSCDGD